MTTKVVEDKPLDEQCSDKACEYTAVAAVWTDSRTNGTIRTTVQWDLSDQDNPPKKATKLCNLHTVQLLTNVGRSLMPSDLRA